MAIKVILRNKEFTFEESMRLRQVLAQLQLPPDSYLALLNGELITEDQVLRQGDEIKLIAVISGG
jgi:sulfur carrier protein ThiS